MTLRTRDLVLFLLLCLIWGTTWIAIKAGLEAVPPLMLAGTRFSAAGLVLFAWTMLRNDWRVRGADLLRLGAAALLLVALCYGLLFWGMQRIDSGTAAVLEMGLTPVALLGFGLLAGEEKLTPRTAGALLVGLVGLGFLFGPAAIEGWTGGGEAGSPLGGGLAVAMAAIVSGWGSNVARPLLRLYPTTLIAGATTLGGGILLVATSIAVEPGALDALRGEWGAAAWAGWLFLVVFGSLVGYTIYMHLLLDVGPARAGMYAFVSPVIAVALGAVVRGEQVSMVALWGMAVLLAAAWLALSGEDSDREVRDHVSPGNSSSAARENQLRAQ